MPFGHGCMKPLEDGFSKWLFSKKVFTFRGVDLRLG